jgi:hypothetical protein
VFDTSPCASPRLFMFGGLLRLRACALRRITLNHIARRIGSNIGQLPSSGAMEAE